MLAPGLTSTSWALVNPTICKQSEIISTIFEPPVICWFYNAVNTGRSQHPSFFPAVFMCWFACWRLLAWWLLNHVLGILIFAWLHSTTTTTVRKPSVLRFNMAGLEAVADDIKPTDSSRASLPSDNKEERALTEIIDGEQVPDVGIVYLKGLRLHILTFGCATIPCLSNCLNIYWHQFLEFACRYSSRTLKSQSWQPRWFPSPMICTHSTKPAGLYLRICWVMWACSLSGLNWVMFLAESQSQSSRSFYLSCFLERVELRKRWTNCELVTTKFSGRH